MIKQIWAIILRNWRRNSKLEFIATLLFFFLIIYFIGFGAGSFIEFSEYGSNYSEFFSIGAITFMLVMAGLFSGLEIVRSRQGFLKILLISPLSKFSILLGQILSTLLTSFYTYFAMLLALLILFESFAPSKILLLFFLVLYIIPIFTSTGVWISSYFKKTDSARRFFSYLAPALFVLSGTIYPIKTLPIPIRYLFYINPITYCIELGRHISIDNSQLSIMTIITVLVGFGLLALILGTYQFDKNMRK